MDATALHQEVRGDEGPSLKTLKFSLYFSGSRIPINPKFSYVYICNLYHTHHVKSVLIMDPTTVRYLVIFVANPLGYNVP